MAGRVANRIHELTLEGDVRPIAGSGARGIDDGPALEATISLPNDLALSPDGGWLYRNDVSPDNPDPRVLTPTCIRRLRL